MGIGASELFLILIIVLVVFGAGKLPRVMSDLGKGVRSFKEGMGTRDEGEEKKKSPNSEL